MSKTTIHDDIQVEKGKIGILNKHLNKVPIQKSHEEFLTRRLCSCVSKLSELEMELFTSKLNYNGKEKK